MRLSRLLLFVWMWGVALAGCDCGRISSYSEPCQGVDKVQPDKLSSCQSSSECQDHYACNNVKGRAEMCCTFTDRKCNTESDCCPGQTCRNNLCYDKIPDCKEDKDCSDQGDMACEDYQDGYGSSKRCRFKACGAQGECPDGLACFQGECMAQLPCGGACAPGTGCVATINRCQEYSKPAGRENAACPMTCAPGFLATFKDGRNIWDACSLSTVSCVCAELPALVSKDIGRFSALAADSARNQLWVSTYDGQYGDLVVYRYDAEGKRQGIEYIDGVPAGQPQYSPSGPRGGVVEPGQDVGRHTDIAVQGENVFVSYYDVTTGDLKLALKSKENAWKTLTVDGAGDVGQYSSVAVDSDGVPGIAYFQRGGASNFDVNSCPAPVPTGDKGFITALKFAKATKALPTQTSDFVVKTVACLSRPIPPCTGCSQTCADLGGSPACYAPATGCTACNPNNEVCINAAGTPKCAKTYKPSKLLEVVDGVGLFSSLTFRSKEAYIAFMRREKSKGQLFGVTISDQNVVSTPVLLDSNGDTGWYPDIKIEPGTDQIAISYHDTSERSLKLYSHPTFAMGVTPTVIDSGIGAVGSGDSSWVGADSTLIFGEAGSKAYIVYQDATRGDLKLAERTNTAWQILPTVRSTGAVGFFADGVRMKNKLYFSHAILRTREVKGDVEVLNALVIDQKEAQ